MELQVGVKVLLKNKEGKYLLMRRSDKEKSGIGKWDIPGGRVEADTSLMENLAREVMEETGLVMTEAPVLVDVQDMQWPDRHVVRIVYSSSAEGTPRLSHEHTEYRWMNAAEISELADFDRYLSELLKSGAIS